MLQSCFIPQKQPLINIYTSCIKIGGVPILPPLITPERRAELRKFKQKAVEVERRLKCQRELRSSVNIPKTSGDGCNNRSYNRTLEHLLSFGDCPTNVLNISTNAEKSDPKLPSEEIDVPCSQTNRKPSKLSCSLFDVTQYSDDGVIVFHDYGTRSDATVGDDNGKPLETKLVQISYQPINTQTLTKKGLSRSFPQARTSSPKGLKSLSASAEAGETKPRLLRSNSYTLESPSPVLLEHLKRQAELEPDTYFMFEKYLNQKRRSLDLNSSGHELSLNLSCRTKESESDFMPLDTENLRDIKIDTGKSLISGENKLIFEELARKHFGAGDKKCDVQEERVENLVVPTTPSENYAFAIIRLLDKYKNERDVELDSYTKLKSDLLNLNENVSKECSDPNDEHNRRSADHLLFDPLLELGRPDFKTSCDDNNTKLSCCNSETLYFSTNTNSLNTSTPLLIDFESEIADSEALLHLERNLNNSDGLNQQLSLMDDADAYLCDRWQRNGDGNCDQEMHRPDKLHRKLKEQWAATVLTAAVKGYLIRRLKRTERVKNLMQTIRDALLCAMSLHTENTEAIQQSDVELHRRLIQQVSAACYEFYDVFFGLTTREQMAMIALDRHRQQEKLKRPASGSGLKLDSGKSTPKSQRRSFSARQRKSLMPSFAA